jgi:hypothetical protein
VIRGPIRNWPVALVALLALVSGAACGPPAAPLKGATAQGLPVLAMATLLVHPGQPSDTEAYVFNSADGPVQITGVTAMAVTDEPEGRLVGVGLQSTGARIWAARGWPPGVPVGPVAGAEIPPGLTGIIFGIAGPAAGHNYAAAGLRIEYEYRGQAYATVAWAGEAACVYGGRNAHADEASCTAFGNKVNAIVEDMSGLY